VEGSELKLLELMAEEVVVGEGRDDEDEGEGSFGESVNNDNMNQMKSNVELVATL